MMFLTFLILLVTENGIIFELERDLVVGGGVIIDDSKAPGGKALELRKTRDKPNLYVLYGPYYRISPGSYRVTFWVRLLEKPHRDLPIFIDIALNYGEKVIKKFWVKDSLLCETNYRKVSINFETPGGLIEFRVYYMGTMDLSIGWVLLEKLKEPSFPPPQNMEDYLLSLPTDLKPIMKERVSYELFPLTRQPAKHLYVLDLRDLSNDWQILLVTLQGVVNSKIPQIYLIFHSSDIIWLEWMMKRGWIRGITKFRCPQELLRKFKGYIRGAVVYDPYLTSTINVSTLISGIYSLVSLSPRLQRELGFKVYYNLVGRWESDVEAYIWAYKNFKGKINGEILALLSPEYIPLRDYLVAKKIFTMWTKGSHEVDFNYGYWEKEMKFLVQVLQDFPVNIPVLGAPWTPVGEGLGEEIGVKILSWFGKFLIPSPLTSNLSLFSGIKGEIKLNESKKTKKVLKDGVIYLCFVVSDGDNLTVLSRDNYLDLWGNEHRGHFPVCWTIAPVSRILCYPILDFYKENSSPYDYFVSATAGVGYITPEDYGMAFTREIRETILRDFCYLTARFLESLGLEEIWLIRVKNPDVFEGYFKAMEKLRGIFSDYGKSHTNSFLFSYPVDGGGLVFHSINRWYKGTREFKVRRLVEEIRGFENRKDVRFLMVFVMNWEYDLSMLNEVIERLKGKFEVVTPFELIELFKDWLEKEGVFLNYPDTVYSIEGEETGVELKAYNPSENPKEFRLELYVEDGLKVFNLGKYELGSKSWSYFILPVGESKMPFKVKFFNEKTTRDFPFFVSPIRREEIKGSLREGRRLIYLGKYEAEELFTRIGEVVKDIDADNNFSLGYIGGRVEDFLLYGPYEYYPEGEYMVLFRLKVESCDMEDSLIFDVAEEKGRKVIEVMRVGIDGLCDQAYFYYPIYFRFDGGELETRIFIKGGARVFVDKVYFYRFM